MRTSERSQSWPHDAEEYYAPKVHRLCRGVPADGRDCMQQRRQQRQWRCCGQLVGTSTAGGTAGLSSTGGVNLAAAQAIVNQYSKPPTGLVPTRLSKKPPTGKYVISVATPESVSQENIRPSPRQRRCWAGGTRPSKSVPARRVRRTPSTRRCSVSPTSFTSPECPASLLKAQLQAAQQQGVKVISDSTVDQATPPIISSSLDSTAQVQKWGEMVAAYIVAATKRPTTAELVTAGCTPRRGM